MTTESLPVHHRYHFWRGVCRLTWCIIGAAAGFGAALWIDEITSPFILASLGGSTVFLFALTRTPPAQPRALFGGHLGCAFTGICCYQLLGDSFGVYVLAMVLSLVFMLVTRTVHPPAGANAVIMIYAHAGFASLWQPVGLGILILAGVAAAWSRVFPGMYRYPAAWLEPSPTAFLGGSWRD